MASRFRMVPWVIVLLGCSHSDPFATSIPLVPPPATSADIQLTYNVDQNYWPIWTQDGRGILYAYVDPGPNAGHRCVGLLPPGGGTRIWSMCHNRATYNDSTSSFTAYALGSDGRLLYAESVSLAVAGVPSPSQAEPYEITLWLADSAAPFTRTALLTLPISLADGTPVFWLGDLAWTGSTTFVALGQNLAIVRHCFGTGFPADPACDFSDSVFSTGGAPAGAVVRGTISGGHATLTVVPGTDGATGYSFAENGASIVFTRRNDARLFKVPASGGTAVAVATVTSATGSELFGVSCRGSMCIVAADGVTLTRLEPSKIFPVFDAGPKELRRVSLATGQSDILKSYGTSTAIAAPQLSPTGDAVIQVGGVWGHLQTFEGRSASVLHLLPGIAP